MLVTDYLRKNSIEQLNKELAIKAVFHPELPLTILNYHQTESPSKDKIVKECRGLVLNSKDYSLVARSFPRFYNYDDAEEVKIFDQTDFSITTKADGSLCLIFCFNGKWMATTRGSFAFGQMNKNSDRTWIDTILEAAKVKDLADLKLDPQLSYVFEFCSPFNKIVKQYDKPVLYHLTSYCGEIEVPDVMCAMPKIESHHFSSLQEASEWVFRNSFDDTTFEGLVACDKNFLRIKIKSESWKSWNRLWCNGTISNPRKLLPFVLRQRNEDILKVYPEYKKEMKEITKIVENSYQELLDLWENNWQIENQKEFAVKVGRNKFSSILFNLRKTHSSNQTETLLRESWLKSGDLIIKALFKE